MPKKKPETSNKVDLNALYPYEHHNTRLEIPEENRVCWFKDSIDADKYIKQHNLNKKKVILTERQ